jgi:hypothetical protein
MRNNSVFPCGLSLDYHPATGISLGFPVAYSSSSVQYVHASLLSQITMSRTYFEPTGGSTIIHPQDIREGAYTHCLLSKQDKETVTARAGNVPVHRTSMPAN